MKDLYASELLSKGKRIDERNLEDFREIEIHKNISIKAEGSALVKLGGTMVMAGVKMNVGTPFGDTPDEGVLMVGAEFTPLASPDFEAGPPSEDAVELARVVDRGLRESKAIKLDELIIKSGEKTWIVYIDIHILNDQGNLIDAAALAAIAALKNSKIPKYEDEKVMRGEYQGEIPMAYTPATVTVCKMNDILFIDPTLEEETTVDTKLSISIRDDDKICALQKQGNGTLSLEDIEKMLDIALSKSKDLRKQVK